MESRCSSLERELNAAKLVISDIKAKKDLFQTYCFHFAAVLDGEIGSDNEAFAAEQLVAMQRGLKRKREHNPRDYDDLFCKMRNAFQKLLGSSARRYPHVTIDKKRRMCCICLTRKATHMFYPCLHVSYCGHCKVEKCSCNGSECATCVLGQYQCAICRTLSSVPPVPFTPFYT